MELARCSICGGQHPVATMVTGHRDPEDLPSGAAFRSPEPHDWWLEDAEAAHAKHPRSFFIPARARRNALRAGDLVRLGFAFGPHADSKEEGHTERMWVEVSERDEAGRVTGRLRNRPARLTELAIGDAVVFEPRHVLAIDVSDEEVGYAQDQSPLVDEAILRDDRAPDVVVRAASPYAEDGEEWWLLVRSGGAGPSSASIGLLTDKFPGLEEPFRAGAGLWELAGGERGSARWRRVGEEEQKSEEWVSLFSWLERSARAMRAADP